MQVGPTQLNVFLPIFFFYAHQVEETETCSTYGYRNVGPENRRATDRAVPA